MSMLDSLSEREMWERFYSYKSTLKSSPYFADELRAFIDGVEYLPVCETINGGGEFPLPRKMMISKLSTQKKRTVYVYPDRENMVLKMLTFMLLRKYDSLFASNLYSFRPHRSAKDAVRFLRKEVAGKNLYYYKADIHDYFNSIPVPALLPVLKDVTQDDPKLYTFLEKLLTEERVLDGGKEITERKGIMAGTPLSSFYANLYLCDLDAHFEKAGITYARYSDDIIVFAAAPEESEANARFIRSFLAEKGLEINPEKEYSGTTDDGWTFLGFEMRGDTVDISPVTLKKLKNKMRRKRDALHRWQKRNDAGGESAAKAFIRVFNRKLLESPEGNELSWSYWFFSVINTDKSLREIDAYAQDCIRYLVSGSHRKSRFNVRYEDMKKLGYKNLVHEYYAFTEDNNE